MMGDKYEVVSQVCLPIEERPSERTHRVWYYGPCITLSPGTILEFLNSQRTYLFGGIKVMRMKILSGPHKDKVVQISKREDLRQLKKFQQKVQ